MSLLQTWSRLDKARPRSVTVEHRDPRMRNCAYNVPIPEVVMFDASNDLCNKCHVRHDVKHIHLDLDENGRQMVSWGVYESLLKAGMPNLDIVGSVAKPPTLILSPRVSRREIDHMNRKQTVWSAHA